MRNTSPPYFFKQPMKSSVSLSITTDLKGTLESLMHSETDYSPTASASVCQTYACSSCSWTERAHTGPYKEAWVPPPRRLAGRWHKPKVLGIPDTLYPFSGGMWRAGPGRRPPAGSGTHCSLLVRDRRELKWGCWFGGGGPLTHCRSWLWSARMILSNKTWQIKCEYAAGQAKQVLLVWKTPFLTIVQGLLYYMLHDSSVKRGWIFTVTILWGKTRGKIYF